MNEDFAVFVPGTMWTTNKERTMHFHQRAQLVKPLREAAELITLNAMRANGVGPFTVPVHVEFFPTQRKAGTLADTANHLPPCKAVLDGVVDAGLLIDDTPVFVLSQRFWPPVKDRSETGVGILITTEG